MYYVKHCRNRRLSGPCNNPYAFNFIIWFIQIYPEFGLDIPFGHRLAKKIIGVRFVDFHGIHLRSIRVCFFWWHLVGGKIQGFICFIKFVSCLYVRYLLRELQWISGLAFVVWNYSGIKVGRCVFFHSFRHIHFILRFRPRCTGKNNVRLIGMFSCTFRKKNIQWNDSGFIPYFFHGMLDFRFLITQLVWDFVSHWNQPPADCSKSPVKWSSKWFLKP